MDAKNVSLLNLSPAQLRKAAELKDRIDDLMRELGQILNGAASTPRPNVAGKNHPTGKRTMSAEGRRRIAEAARVRWAKVRAEKGHAQSAATSGVPKKRTMSAAARRKIAAAARARWAKVRAAKQKS